MKEILFTMLRRRIEVECVAALVKQAQTIIMMQIWDKETFSTNIFEVLVDFSFSDVR